MPEKHEKIKYLPGKKLLKAPVIIFADLECLLKRTQYCQNNPKNSYTEKKLSINLQDTHGFQYAHLMIQKTSAIFIGERTLLKSFVKT